MFGGNIKKPAYTTCVEVMTGNLHMPHSEVMTGNLHMTHSEVVIGNLHMLHVSKSNPNVLCPMSCFYCVQLFQVRGDCLFCWYWWNCWPSLFKLSFHNVVELNLIKINDFSQLRKLYKWKILNGQFTENIHRLYNIMAFNFHEINLLYTKMEFFYLFVLLI